MGFSRNSQILAIKLEIKICKFLLGKYSKKKMYNSLYGLGFYKYEVKRILNVYDPHISNIMSLIAWTHLVIFHDKMAKIRMNEDIFG